MGVVGYEAVSGKRPFTGDGALTVAMKHIKEPPPPLPAELPPNVRELIEITLVKNPQMRYRSGGPFADAVAAVRAGRRPPRPSQSPPPGRAAPAAIPSSAPARIAGNPTSRATARVAPGRRPEETGHPRGVRSRRASGRCCGLPASSGRWPSSSRCSSSSIRVATTSRSYRPRP
ncbi:putative serine/threonine-kinase pknA domain protein [Mycobacterium kansasii]|uniref:Putative serine/threonine-kinase pknA domain protein n=1 Tax=Mycobacterium kansasii TaxID=1768 RepID=A0A1V3X9K7_MYCKA|nr:putative serine/threonine-kinase pknA domain protein [Mycobacterium kansasii]